MGLPKDEVAFRSSLFYEAMARTAIAWDNRRRSRGEPEPPFPIGVPAVALLAFSLELEFKAVLLMHGKEPARVHGLVGLFDQITEEIPAAATSLREHFWRALRHCRKNAEAKAAGKAGTSFEEALTAADELFQVWRYSYEKPRDPSMHWDAWSILFGTRAFIREKRPTWLPRDWTVAGAVHEILGSGPPSPDPSPTEPSD